MESNNYMHKFHNPLFLSLLITCLSFGCADPVFYVKPTDAGQCPSNPCHVFGHYLQNSQKYFLQSNTVFYFLQGNHTVREPGTHVLKLVEVSNVSLVGLYWQPYFSSSGSLEKMPAIITCTTRHGFHFISTNSILVANLTFSRCGSAISPFSKFSTTIAFENSSNANIVGVVIENSMGFGLRMSNVLGESQIAHSKFISNRGNEYYYGGNVFFQYYLMENTCNSQSIKFNVLSSEFKDGYGPAQSYSPGFHLEIQHLCTDIHVHFDNVVMSGNVVTENKTVLYNVYGGNLGIIVIEPENAIGKHHTKVTNSRFENGIADAGGGIALYCFQNQPQLCQSNTHSFNSLEVLNTTISGNTAVTWSGGGIFLMIHKVCQIYIIILNGAILRDNNVRFNHTVKSYGNMAFFLNTRVARLVELPSLAVENSIFELGMAERCGGVGVELIYAVDTTNRLWNKQPQVIISNSDFIGNGGYQSGSLMVYIYISRQNLQTIEETIKIKNCIFMNSFSLFGSSVLLSFKDINFYDNKVDFILENVSFKHHQQNMVMHILVRGIFFPKPEEPNFNEAVLYVSNIKNLTLINCRFYENDATPLMAYHSNIFFIGTVLFLNNYGLNGGAIALTESFMLLTSKTRLQFYSNHAVWRGGAIFIQHWTTVSYPNDCFLQPIILPGASIRDFGMMIKFVNNTAGVAGSLLYGSNIDHCVIHNYDSQNRANDDQYAYQLFHFLLNYTEQNDPSVIASDPLGVCFCEYGKRNCKIELMMREVYAGDTFEVPAVVVGQREGIVPGNIRAAFTDGEDQNLHALGDDLQYLQTSNQIKSCSNLTYSVLSGQIMEQLMLTTENSNSLLLRRRFAPVIAIHLRTCPLGFSLSGVPAQCSCASLLAERGYSCNIHTQTIHRPRAVWIGCLNKYPSVNNCTVVLHAHCPLDYCKPQDTDLNLQFPDSQCLYNHSGILCGKCQHGLSLALGTSQCLKCSNVNLTFLIAFAVAGLALVALITLCNLVTSEGTLSALTLYANIIQVSRPAFLNGNENNVLTVFVAWLNLDLGIETCFYNGMDMYAKAWLQLLFPVYIWLIVAVMIGLSYYTTAARIIGQNSPKVLATLFLLSYAKLLRAVITILSFTYLEYPDGHSKAVWLYDGNVDYLRGKHIPLFIAAIATLIGFLIPYTFVVCFMQCLRRKSGCKMLSWVRRLKPVMDPYGGPYKDKYQFWTGLLLVVRVLLFLAFAFNTSGNPAINLLLVAITSIVLLCMQLAFFSGVYKNKIHDIFEALFLANLGIVASATLFVQLIGESLIIPTFLSIAISQTIFPVVLLYHLYKHTPIKIWINKVKVHSRKVDNIPMQVFSSPGSNHSEIGYEQMVQQQIQPPVHARAHRLTLGEDGELVLLTDN